MRVYIAHADADQAAADELKEYLKPNGYFAETESGARGFRYLQPSDIVIVLWSRNCVFSPYRMQLEQRLLDAWADERLVLVKLDHNFLPVGARDLPAIDASFESARQMTSWRDVARQTRERMNALLVKQQEERAAREAAAAPMEQLEADVFLSYRRPDPANFPQIEALTALLKERGLKVLLPEFEASFSDRAAWADRAVKAAKLVLGLWNESSFTIMDGQYVGLQYNEAMAANEGQKLLPVVVEAGVETPAPFAALHFSDLSNWDGRCADDAVSRLLDQVERRIKQAPPSLSAADEPDDALFVSYAHADDLSVGKVVGMVEDSGRAVWIDKGGIQAGQGWAGEIVRAIKAAGGVLIMCSKRAFESDHVKREVYLADRYKKPMLPIFIEAADPPEDFEYFFAAVQWLELFKLPDGEHDGAVAKALAGVR